MFKVHFTPDFRPQREIKTLLFQKKYLFSVGDLIHERDRQVNEFSYIVFVVYLQ